MPKKISKATKVIPTTVKQFLMVEINNDGGEQPATLGSAFGSYEQCPYDTLYSWCGFRDELLVRFSDKDKVLKELHLEVGKELRSLIRHYGSRKELEDLID